MNRGGCTIPRNWRECAKDTFIFELYLNLVSTAVSQAAKKSHRSLWSVHPCFYCFIRGQLIANNHFTLSAGCETKAVNFYTDKCA